MKIELSGQTVNVSENTMLGVQPPAPEPIGLHSAALEGLNAPLDVPPLAKWDLHGKTAAVLVDDWGRPTLCGEFLPEVLNRLNRAGVPDESITIITASGMHDPMGDEDMCRKVGEEAFRRVRCHSHDGGNREMLVFMGITPLGSPVWVNRYAAEADFKISLGRIYPHCTYGYEGSYKMIVPGVASFETIVRDHSLNYSDHSNYGILEGNPSRGEADAIGRMVGLDYTVNFVIDWDGNVVKGFGGTPEASFRAGVDFGQHRVWSCVTGKRADIAILCGREMGDLSLSNNPTYYIGLAMGVTEPDGVIISTMQYQHRPRHILEGYDLDTMPFGELVRLHEKRNWNLEERRVQHVIKSIRGAFYERRIFEQRSQKLFFVAEDFPRTVLERWNARQFPTIQAAYDAAERECAAENPFVLAVPDAKRVLPLLRYDYGESL